MKACGHGLCELSNAFNQFAKRFGVALDRAGEKIFDQLAEDNEG
jgi:hypothetical protein